MFHVPGFIDGQVFNGRYISRYADTFLLEISDLTLREYRVKIMLNSFNTVPFRRFISNTTIYLCILRRKKTTTTTTT